MEGCVFFEEGVCGAREKEVCLGGYGEADVLGEEVLLFLLFLMPASWFRVVLRQGSGGSGR